MSTSLSALIPELQPFARDLVNGLNAEGLRPQVTSTRRSHAEQQRLYERYLTGAQKYYTAVPGTSPHEYGYAFDLVCDDQEYAGSVWLSWGGEWGGRSTRGHPYDPVHFQYPGFNIGIGTTSNRGTRSSDRTYASRWFSVNPNFGPDSGRYLIELTPEGKQLLWDIAEGLLLGSL